MIKRKSRAQLFTGSSSSTIQTLKSHLNDWILFWIGKRRLLLIGFLFIAAFGIRLFHINEPPLNFHATRQYRSLLIARGYYYEHLSTIPEWKSQVARVNQQRQGILEPPIMELLTSIGYRLFGGEYFWIPRTISALFWLIGGFFVYLIARKIADPTAALFSSAFYLFLPFAVTASRSFQPDPLMILLMCASVYAMLQYDDKPTNLHLAIVILISALSIFIKPVSLFVIIASFLTITLIRKGVQRLFADPHVFVFFILTLLPTLLFYINGVFISGFLKDQARSSFLPQLLLDPFFWTGWLTNIRSVIGFGAFFGALIGVMMFRPGRPRSIMVGMWVGYILFCFVFDYHIATHDYYHLQLIPIAALSLGPLGSLAANRLLEYNREWYWRAAIASIALIAFIFVSYEALLRLADPTSANRVKVAEEIGGLVDHSLNSIHLSEDYGLSLEYHGELSGLPWPLVSDLEWEQLAGVHALNAEERYNAWFAKLSPEYFIVTDLQEFNKQADLKSLLSRKYSLLASSDDYMIFDLGNTAVLKR